MPAVTTKPDDIYDAFLDDLASGAIRPGQRVGEKSLARRWSVSRVPVREMLIRLEAEGFVDREYSTGTFVRQIDTEEYEELFELRVAIESVVVRRVARLATTRQLDELARMARELDKVQASQDKALILRQEREFHMRLCDLSGMRHAGRVLRLERFLVLTLQTNLNVFDPAAADDGHAELVAALRTRDPERAEAVLRKQYADDLVRVRRRIESARPGVVVPRKVPGPRIWQR